MTASNPILVAIDRPDLDGALALANALADHVGGIKLGLEFFVANGPGGVERIAEIGLPIFLDLKLHDIPNTVAGAMRGVARLPVAMITIHASGGKAMIEAAVEAAQTSRKPPWVLAVTVLTSIDAQDMAETGVSGDPAAQVQRLGQVAIDAGADGLICSPLEIASLRQTLGASPKLVVPGIRPTAVEDDQKRTLTPVEAVKAGATRLVVGRPITAKADPAAAAASILDSLN